MTQRFRVIKGGLSQAQTPRADDTAPRTWRVDLKPAAEIDGGTRAAWRALAAREPEASTLSDPDYLLPAARHQADAHSLVFALAWSRGEETEAESLHGVVPLALPHPVWGRGRVRHWQAPGTGSEGLVEARYADEVAAALRRRLDAGPRRLTLDPASRTTPRAHAGRRLAAVPADSLVGVRPAAAAEPAETEHVSEPARIRDAVETFLALDARASQNPIVADPSEATMVRVVSRLFARRRQASVELVRRGGEVVSGALRLGSGARAVTWRQASLDPERG